MPQQQDITGHRNRLRQRFLSDRTALSEAETLELLLTYAIPRRDVAPLAEALLDRFGNIGNVLTARYDELVTVPGIGEQAATLIQVVAQLAGEPVEGTEVVPDIAQQPPLFEVEPALGPLFDIQAEPEEPQMRTFANDEIANSLTFIPQAAQFESFEAFKAHLRERLPYNSESTRERRPLLGSVRAIPAGRGQATSPDARLAAGVLLPHPGGHLASAGHQ